MRIFIDLKKAFDTVSHDILLTKLGRYGIRGITNTWILEIILQIVYNMFSFDQHMSPTLSVTCGVPQGSILGLLLFLWYINDIYDLI